MKFFIPGANAAEQEQQVYSGIKTFLGKELGAQFSDRRVHILRWRHDGKEYEAEVGKTTNFNGEVVIAILYETQRDLYHVCTSNRGVVCNMSILAGGHSVKNCVDFDSE
jgi:hypothetical protein